MEEKFSVKDMGNFLLNGSILWHDRTDQTIIIVLHSCKTGKGDNSIAQRMSEDENFHNILIVAPSENVAVPRSSEGHRELGAARTTISNSGQNVLLTDAQGNYFYGAWKMFLNRKQVDSFHSGTKPIFNNPTKTLQRYAP